MSKPRKRPKARPVAKPTDEAGDAFDRFFVARREPEGPAHGS
jgi:hypothetical protein